MLADEDRERYQKEWEDKEKKEKKMAIIYIVIFCILKLGFFIGGISLITLLIKWIWNM